MKKMTQFKLNKSPIVKASIGISLQDFTDANVKQLKLELDFSYPKEGKRQNFKITFNKNQEIETTETKGIVLLSYDNKESLILEEGRIILSDKNEYLNFEVIMVPSARLELARPI